MNHDQIKKYIIDYINEHDEMTDYKMVIINRYINLIRNTSKNINIKKFESSNKIPRKHCIKTERHHILPKSIFPQYKLFSKFPWNEAILTLKEHFIAHIMLHHIFKGKMSLALLRMSHSLGKSRLYEACMLEYRNSDEQIKNAKLGASALNEKMKMGMRIYYDVNGYSHGLMFEDNEKIKLYNLTLDRKSEKMILQRELRSKLAAESNKGTIIYNNGKINKKFKKDEIIPNDWIKGGLPRNRVIKHIKYDWSKKENIDLVMKLLIKHNGVLSDVGNEIGLSATNIKKNMKKFMPGIYHYHFWIPKKRYKIDKEYAEKIYYENDCDFEKIYKIIGSNVNSVKEQYKKLWNLT